MNSLDLLRSGLHSADFVIRLYTEDLSDDDLFVQPVPGATSHIAFQLGHLIAAENMFVATLKPEAAGSLPEGFAQAHSKERAYAADRAGFLTKGEYLKLMAEQRSRTMAFVETLTEADLDRETPGPAAGFAPTWGRLLMIMASHPIMHSGQFAVIRRKLQKPIVM